MSKDKVIEIILKPHQKEHAQRCRNILENFDCYWDLSPFGSGKTYIVGHIAQTYDLGLFVVCPKSMVPIWEKFCKTHGIRVVLITTYQTLRSVKNCQPTHGFLKRDDSKPSPKFIPTEEFMNELQRGMLLVGDEIAAIKNKNCQHKAFRTLAKCLYDSNTTSRYVFLSGAPFDKKEHAVNLLYFMGCMKMKKLYVTDQNKGIPELKGARDLLEYCMMINPKVTQEIVDNLKEFFIEDNKVYWNCSVKEIIDLCYKLLAKALKPHIISSMPMPKLPVKLDIKNGYYKMDNPQMMIDAINMLRRATGFISGEDLDISRVNFGAVTKALVKMETSLVPVFERLVRNKLKELPKCKVIVGVNYVKDVLLVLADRLKDLNPILLYGKTTKRGEVVEEFQNNPSRRLLLAVIPVGGVGLSFQDLKGDEPRITFSTPGYRVLELHQFTGRTYREGSKSDAYMRFVYGNVTNKTGNMLKPVSILDALSRKDEVLRDFLDEHVKSGVKFPGEHEDEIEN